jgi:hypothetical protein
MTHRKDLVPAAGEFLVDGDGREGCTSSAERGSSMTDIVRREAEFPLCLSMASDQRGFVLQPGDAT